MNGKTRWVRIASGDYETSDGRYRIYRIPDLRPAAWNCEVVWTEAEWDAALPWSMALSELVVDGAASLRDAQGIFESRVESYEKERTNV